MSSSSVPNVETDAFANSASAGCETASAGRSSSKFASSSKSALKSSSEPESFGVALGFAAFLIWGLFPLYFALLRPVPPLVTLAFRAVFTTVLLTPIVLWRGKGPAIVAAIRNPKYALGLFITMATTAASWGLFIWLVAINHTLYASLGNYVSPLANVLFGAIFFRERPRLLASIAIFLAALGVTIFAFGVGRLPWESVVVAFVFAIYSLLRKKMNVDSTTALSVETLFSLPIAAVYLVWVGNYFGNAQPFWATRPYWLTLLIGAGALTAIPLLLFGSAARRVKLSTLGLLQYLTPTGQFLCGAFLFDEKTTPCQWASFGFIWVALALFSVELFQNERRFRRKRGERDAANVERNVDAKERKNDADAQGEIDAEIDVQGEIETEIDVQGETETEIAAERNFEAETKKIVDVKI